jgi:hypothetical protein
MLNPFFHEEKWMKKIIWGGIFLGLAALGAFLAPYTPDPVALKALESTSEVEVKKTSYGWEFTSKHQPKDCGLVFYPGAKVAAVAYAPLMQRVAKKGCTAALLEVPLNLAILAPNKALEPIQAHPELDWVVGGHSMGGVVASNLLGRPEVEGVVFWASYPQKDLSQTNYPTLALFGAQDGILTSEERLEQLSKLPASARVQILEGVNHSRFGAYGLQKGDNPAGLPQEKAWDLIAQETVQFLSER